MKSSSRNHAEETFHNVKGKVKEVAGKPSDNPKIKGMGAIPHAGGVAFRVWAPHAERVSVIGSFNGWDSGNHPMQTENNGYWYADVTKAHVGDQYKFLLTTEKGEFNRIDPYAREVTSSVGNAIVHNPHFAWEGDDFQGHPSTDVVAEPGEYDGFPFNAALSMGPYSVLIYSQ